MLKCSFEVKYLPQVRKAGFEYLRYSKPRQPYDSKVLKAITGTCRQADDRDSTSELILY